MTVPRFVEEITEAIGKLNPLKQAIPEQYPLLRAIQFALRFRKK